MKKEVAKAEVRRRVREVFWLRWAAHLVQQGKHSEKVFLSLFDVVVSEEREKLKVGFREAEAWWKSQPDKKGGDTE